MIWSIKHQHGQVLAPSCRVVFCDDYALRGFGRGPDKQPKCIQHFLGKDTGCCAYAYLVIFIFFFVSDSVHVWTHKLRAVANQVQRPPSTP
jgi:hypothetical protein